MRSSEIEALQKKKKKLVQARTRDETVSEPDSTAVGIVCSRRHIAAFMRT